MPPKVDLILLFKALLNDSVDFHCERTLSAGRAPSLHGSKASAVSRLPRFPKQESPLFRSKQRDLQKSTLNDNTALFNILQSPTSICVFSVGRVILYLEGLAIKHTKRNKAARNNLLGQPLIDSI